MDEPLSALLKSYYQTIHEKSIFSFIILTAAPLSMIYLSFSVSLNMHHSRYQNYFNQRNQLYDNHLLYSYFLFLCSKLIGHQITGHLIPLIIFLFQDMNTDRKAATIYSSWN